MGKNKANKGRNIGFIFEALTREVAKASIEGDKVRQDRGMYAIKTFFASDTNIGKVLSLYQTLLETKGVTDEQARRILNEVYKVFADYVDKNELESEQGEMTDYINANFDKKALFMNFIPNYKSLATIGQLFSNNLRPNKKIMLEDVLCDSMSTKIEEQAGQNLEPMDKLSLSIYINNFNEKFSQELLPEQRTLLGRYITSISDNGTALKVFINDELGRIKGALSESKSDPEIATDAQMLDGINRIEKMCQAYQKRPIDESAVGEIMKLQALIHEVNKNDSKG